ncbi:MAG TPA: ABC transporter permease [Candidatus Limnocylindrales bacterium]|nr:ABC transporter permease [Candidatus Limnocylindrales bacterium]
MIQLGKVLALGRVNLLRQVRDRSDLFFVFVLPTIIIVALGLQFGGTSRARLGVVAPTGDAAAEALVAAIEEDGTRFEIRRVADEDALVDQVERGQVEAGIAIPDGFTAALQGTGTVEIRYLGTTDALAAGLQAPVAAEVAKLGAITTATRIAVDEGLGDWPTAQAAAEAGYETVPGVEVSVALVGEPGIFAGFSQFTFGASTQLILFMFLTSMTAAGRLVHTKQLGVSRRMVSTPTSVWTIVAGEALGRYLVALLQAAYIVAVTAIVFGVSWGDPLAAGVIIALFGLVAAGAAMLVGALSHNADQASSLGVFAGLALGALGGCMIPWQMMPDVMQSIARLIPHSWALLGLQELVRTGGGLSTVAPNVAVLAVYGVVLMGLAGWRFRKAIAG